LSPPLTADEREWHHYCAVVQDAGPVPRVALYRDGEPLVQGVVEEKGEGFEGLRGLVAAGSGNEPDCRE
jgi:hypothetical protein